MSDIEKKFEFAKRLRRPDEAAVKRITEHFQAAGDIFTQCPRCKQTVRGTYQEVLSHRCPDAAGS